MSDPHQPLSASSETLDSGGTPVPHERTPRTRSGVIIGGLAGAVAIAGAGVWGWTAYFAQGPQPDEALPANTIAYASIDLDPPANQKVEAIQTLRKFPSFRKDFDLNTDDDIRKKLFEAIQGEGACKDLDYEDDVEPWLGNRAAAALVPGKDPAEPDPVVVLQVTDTDKAEDKLPEVIKCLTVGGSSSSTGSDSSLSYQEETDSDQLDVTAGDDPGESPVEGYSFSGDWVVLAETEDIAVDVTDGAADSSLADDATYQDWMDQVGDPGIMSMYAAPEAGAVLERAAVGDGVDVPEGEAFSLKDFQGAAANLRFADNGIELEFAGDQKAMTGVGLFDGANGDAQISDLPDTTAVAFGGSMSKGWLEGLFDTFGPTVAGATDQPSVETMRADLERELGVSVDDIQTLTEQPYAVVLDGEFSTRELDAEGLEALPLGFKITGDEAEIERILDQVRGKLPADAALFSQRVADGVVVSTSPTYLKTLAQSGDLADSDAYQDVLPEAEDADAIVFLDFDAGGGWLDRLAADDNDPEVSENVKPLEALGLTIDTDGDVAHGKLRLTVD